jgi:Ca-activated chloride channel homolog
MSAVMSTVLVATLATPVFAQVGSSPQPATEQAPAPSSGEPLVTFKGGVEAVTVSVAVRDQKGRVVRGLTKADFELFDSGRPKAIDDFYTGDSPISLAVLLDISGSMSVGGNMDRARDAVAVAMKTLSSDRDEAALFTFDSELQQVVNFTTELDRVRRVSLHGKPWGKTSLYDAVASTARLVGERANKHRALLVITDGVDTASRMSAPEVSAIASSIDVPVYLLTVVNPSDHQGGEFAVLQTDGKAAETATLADLARWTGGDMRIASMPAHTVEAIQDLFTELRYQYLITFEPAELPGWHPLEIRMRKKNMVVHARSGYMSGPSPADSHVR